MKNINLKIMWKKFKHSFVNIGSDADKDWRIILSVFFVLMLVSVAWNINTYLHIYDVPTAASATNVKANKSINVGVLSKMIGIYDERAEEFQNIVESKKALVDPSH